MSFIQKPDGTDELVSSMFVDRFRCDGKAYPMLNRAGLKGTSELICHSLSNSSLDAVFRHSDRGPTVAHLEVSNDGKTLSETLETVDASSKKKVETLHFSRMSGKDGLAGDWKDAAPDPSRVIRFTLSAHAIIFETPLAHAMATLLLSGAEAHSTKDGVVGKTTEALQVDTPERFRMTTRYDGVVVAQTVFSLSPDGNTIDEAFWLQQHPEEIARNTYRRSR